MRGVGEEEVTGVGGYCLRVWDLNCRVAVEW